MANTTSNEQRTIDIIVRGQQANASINEMAAAQRVLNAQIVKMAADDPRREKLIEQYSQLKSKMVEVRGEMNNTGGALSKLTSLLGPLGVALSATFVVQKVIGFFRSASEAEKEFEVSLSNLSAITGATGKDLEFYRKQAEEVGRTTTHAASEVVEAYKLIGSAKPELLKNKEALADTAKEVLALSDASGLSLPDATTAAIGALNQFGAGADQAGRFVNVLAAGAKEGSAEIPQVAEALKNAGTVAAAANVSFEATNATIQALADISIKGGEAGTGLRNVLLTLQAGAKDTNPVVVGYNQALENLANKHLSAAEMTKLFGKENIVVAQQMITARGHIGELTKAVTGTSEAYIQAAKNTDNLEGDTKRLAGVYDGFVLGVGKGVNGGLRLLVQFLTELLKQSQPVIDVVKSVGHEFGELFDDCMDVARSLGFVTDKSTAAGVVIKVLAGIISGFLLPLKLGVQLVDLLVEGFIKVYNAGNRVASGLQEMGRQFTGFFTDLRNNALKALGGLGDIIVGIFTLDPDKVKAGFAAAWDATRAEARQAGQRAGDAFAAGYANAKQITRRKVSADTPDDTAEAGDGTDPAAAEAARLKALQDQRDAAAKDAAEKAEKAREKAAKAAEAARKRELAAQRQHDEALLKSWQAFQDAQVAAIPDKTERAIAAINLEYERKMDVVKGSEEAQTEQLAQLNAARLQAIADVQAKADEEAAKKRRENIDAQLGEEEADQEAQLEMLQSALDRGMMAEQAYADAVYNVKRVAKENEIELLKQKFGEESAEVARAQRQMMSLDVQHTKDTKKLAAERMQFEVQMQSVRQERIKMVSDAIVGILDTELKGWSGWKQVRKIVALAQIGIELEMQKSAISLAAAAQAAQLAAIPGGQAAIPGVWALAAAKMTNAEIQAIISGVKVLAFAQGGNTSQGSQAMPIGRVLALLAGQNGGRSLNRRDVYSFAPGGRQDEPRLGLIGEAGAELVIPNWLYAEPKMANLMGALEAMIDQRQVVPYATGGATSAVSRPNLPLPAGGSDEVAELLRQMLGKFDGFRDEVTTWQRELQINLPMRDFDRQYTTYKEVNTGGGIKN